jgi:enolase
MTNKNLEISTISAREILDSRGNPTVEVTVSLGEDVGVASVPSGASTGRHEAHELRDGDPDRYAGLGVLKAVAHVNRQIHKELTGRRFTQAELDQSLIELDGTANKTRLGANALLGVSLAFARAMAQARAQELYLYLADLAGQKTLRLPTPLVNILNGGKHADSGLDLQEFMIIPVGIRLFRNQVRVCSEIFHTLKELLEKADYAVGVGDEGGFAPHLAENEQALDLITRAITAAGYTTKQVKLGLDAAASSFYKNRAYHLSASRSPKKLTALKLIEWYQKLAKTYPLMLIEDGLAEDDWTGFQQLRAKLGQKLIIVGDDLTVTNTQRINQASYYQAINAVLIKLNQIGTLTETLTAIKRTEELGWQPIISHRSGETTDTFIADLAVGTGAPYIKAGSMSRGERIAKYDRLLEIEEQLLNPDRYRHHIMKSD